MLKSSRWSLVDLLPLGGKEVLTQAVSDLEGLLLGLGALTSRDPRLTRSDRYSNNASSQPRSHDDEDEDDDDDD